LRRRENVPRQNEDQGLNLEVEWIEAESIGRPLGPVC
jgi:hypothetical protein